MLIQADLFTALGVPELKGDSRPNRRCDGRDFDHLGKLKMGQVQTPD